MKEEGGERNAEVREREDEIDSQPAIRDSELAVRCPFCNSSDVKLFSMFGSQLLTSEYYCGNCRTVFENLKR